MSRKQLLQNKSIFQLIPDVETGVLLSGAEELTTNVVSVTIPIGAVGFRLYPTTNDIRFAVDEDPVAVGTLTDDSLTCGGIAKAGQWEKRYIGISDVVRTLNILCSTTTNVATEIF